ncbi:MAG: nucleotide exchange factor GrpE, partial [Pseudomonadota bacterium]
MSDKPEGPNEAQTEAAIQTEAVSETPAETAPAFDAEAELAAAKDQLLRTLAEMENLRKRTQREVEETRRYAVTGFARDLLDVIDNLGRAVQHIPDEVREQEGWAGNLATGIAMTERALLNVLEKHKVQRVAPTRGEK